MEISARRRSARSSKRRRKAVLYTVLIIIAAILIIAFGLYYLRVPQKVMYPLKYRSEIMKSSITYGLDPCLVAAVINTESGFDPNAVSGAGAVGLMQLMPETAEWAAQMRGMSFDPELLTEPQYNIDLGCWLLNYLLKRYNNKRCALAAYNAGSGALDGWLKNEEYLNENGELAVIPYPETANYVEKVLKAEEQYLAAYGEDLED